MEFFDYSKSSMRWLLNDLPIHSSEKELFEAHTRDDFLFCSSSLDLHKKNQVVLRNYVSAIALFSATLEMLVIKIINSVASFFRSIFFEEFNNLRAVNQQELEQFEEFNNLRAANQQELEQLEEWQKEIEESLQNEIEESFLDPNNDISIESNLSIERKDEKGAMLINVPDDGNCLFYAIGIGLKKNYPEDIEIQKKLGWEVDPNSLQGNLSKAYELLAAPGKLLREQAAQHLSNESKLDENKKDESFRNALIGGIEDHIIAVKKEIEGDKSIILILDEELNELRERKSQDNDTLKQIEEKKLHKKSLEESIELQEKNMPKDENDIERYIALTSMNYIYCGIVQVLSLCKVYDIPIKVIYDYGKEGQYEQTYNQKENAKRKVLTLAHVNDNHFKFKYIDSTDK
jgi:hypothetical protein